MMMMMMPMSMGQDGVCQYHPQQFMPMPISSMDAYSFNNLMVPQVSQTAHVLAAEQQCQPSGERQGQDQEDQKMPAIEDSERENKISLNSSSAAPLEIVDTATNSDESQIVIASNESSPFAPSTTVSTADSPISPATNKPCSEQNPCRSPASSLSKTGLKAVDTEISNATTLEDEAKTKSEKSIEVQKPKSHTEER